MLRRYFAERQAGLCAVSAGRVGGYLRRMPMDMSRAARAERLGPYFEIQLRFAARMAELSGISLGEAAYRHTNLSRRFGQGIPVLSAPTEKWLGFAERLEAARSMAEQVALCQATFREVVDEKLPLAGQEGFGCFAFEPPKDGLVKIHFNNKDTDGAGGPLASAKSERRRAELAA